ncbi:phage tail assembly protein [Pseudomonas oryzihabitans]|uniref:Phage tail protein n=1 Tax=Pseudomonas oryzihabitans TaxID=47885 RepID=A0AAJ2BJ39_9PSED|nr:phage tail assembly protein [Pseudomonas psychrotolerans]APQ13408.1 phage tail protein [Pseudomonas psychrotolerans]KTT10753.1 tail fiber protein [Pseudomonas psychrotolerans]MDR6233552.1 hypothetical protein [Pseudomonas psychrotolerans]MDR6357405.1 hypothetical protein [Pseudomonas psychrotolerans]
MTATTQDNLVVLDQPVQRGETRIEEISLRKPTAGELRGVSLSELLNLNVDAIVRIVPRISQPSLSEAEVRALDPADLVDLGGKIVGFLLKKSDKAALFPAT